MNLNFRCYLRSPHRYPEYLAFCHQEGLKHQPIKMPSHISCAIQFQGDGEEQAIFHRIKQQEKFPNTAQVKVATFEDPRQISKQRILFLRAACCIVNVEYRPCSAFLMASQFLIMEEIILIFVTNLSKLYLLPHPDVDGRWQQALERGLGHQGGAEGSGGQNLGFQT